MQRIHRSDIASFPELFADSEQLIGEWRAELKRTSLRFGLTALLSLPLLSQWR